MSFELPFSVEPALDALREAIAMAMERHGAPNIEVKDDDTLVTDADRDIETMLRERLSALAPGWSFLGEEGGLNGDPDAPCWVIDPIDGTTNYARDIPLWCISVGAVHGGKPVFGMIAVPEIGEILWAVEGQGAYHLKNGATKRLRVHDHLPLQQEDLLGTNTTAERVLDFSKVPCRLRNFGALAYHLTVLARGSVVGIIAHYHKLYDVAAGLCICFEAGCEARYLDGTLWRAIVSSDSETHPLFCAPPQTLQEMLAKLEPKAAQEAVIEGAEIEES